MRATWQIVEAGGLSALLTEGAARVFIDMPIGLSPDGARPADRQLRAAPGVRPPTVFTPPCRAALHAASHAEASRLNRQACGKGLSIQAWNIVPRMREVDELLAHQPALRTVVVESHPEWVFAGFAGNENQQPLPPKKTSLGQQRRLALLNELFPPAEDWLADLLSRTRRADVQADDALDALALAVSAALAERHGVERLGGEVDDTGLTMQVVRHRVHGVA